MKQTIPLSAITRNTPDAICTDGELSECVNVIYESGGITPVLSPVHLINEPIELMYIHRVKTVEYWIYRDASTLFFIKDNVGERVTITTKEVPLIHKIDSLGNVLLLLKTGKPNEYVFYINGEYKVLGSKPPMLNPKINWNPAGRITNSITFGETLSWADKNLVVSAEFNSIKETKRKLGQSIAPYWIRLAYKLYDGSYIWHSNPILIPGKKIAHDLTNNNISVEVVEAVIKLSLTNMTFNDIITDVSIFATEQCYQNLFDEENPGRWPVYNDKFDEVVLEASRTFYHIKDYPITESTLDISYNPVTDILNLTTKDTDILPDEFRSHHLCMAEDSFSYNSRMNLIGVKHIFSEPPVPVYTINQKGSLPAYDKTMYGGVIQVIIEEEGTYHFVYCSCDMGIMPPFFYYPDSRAVAIRYYPYKPLDKGIKLKKHPYLNGAYAFGLPLYNMNTPFDSANYWDYWEGVYLNNAVWPTKFGDGTYKEDNKVFLSETNNLLQYPASLRYSVGSRGIVGISTTAKALSQGQFGQFPLYAFTEDGIWAMEISSSGTYSSKQIVSRDVCLNRKSITQLDNAIAFVSSKGLMIIQGAECTCISDAMKGKHLDLSGYQDISKEGYPVLRNNVSFVDYIQDCFMAYDYSHNRIIIINNKYDFQYAYSLNTNSFSVLNSGNRFISRINNFPFVYLNDNSGVWSVLTDNDINDVTVKSKGFILTRPIKFGDSFAYKTINRMYLRGNFDTAKCILYGSIDGFNYKRITSLRGTPWKYFRVAIYSDLLPTEFITHIDVDVEPKRTNRLR